MAEGPFEFSNPRVECIIFGHGKVKTAGDEATRLGSRRALVAVSPSVARTPLIEKIRAALAGVLYAGAPSAGSLSLSPIK